MDSKPSKLEERFDDMTDEKCRNLRDISDRISEVMCYLEDVRELKGDLLASSQGLVSSAVRLEFAIRGKMSGSKVYETGDGLGYHH